MNISTIELLDKHEEKKENSPKSSVSDLKLAQESNIDIAEYFDHID